MVAYFEEAFLRDPQQNIPRVTLQNIPLRFLHNLDPGNHSPLIVGDLVVGRLINLAPD